MQVTCKHDRVLKRTMLLQQIATFRGLFHPPAANWRRH
jgi:hypothetical protein